jgi:hypothetical protein
VFRQAGRWSRLDPEVGAGALGRELPLRKQHQRWAPIRKAFAPQQIVRLQVSELDELGKLRIAQRPILLPLASEVPLYL